MSTKLLDLKRALRDANLTAAECLELSEECRALFTSACAMEAREWKVGDRVMMNDHYRVERGTIRKINRVTVTIDFDNGRAISCSPGLLQREVPA